jgi:hypothetical protein
VFCCWLRPLCIQLLNPRHYGLPGRLHVLASCVVCGCLPPFPVYVAHACRACPVIVRLQPLVWWQVHLCGNISACLPGAAAGQPLCLPGGSCHPCLSLCWRWVGHRLADLPAVAVDHGSVGGVVQHAAEAGAVEPLLLGCPRPGTPVGHLQPPRDAPESAATRQCPICLLAVPSLSGRLACIVSCCVPFTSPVCLAHLKGAAHSAACWCAWRRLASPAPHACCSAAVNACRVRARTSVWRVWRTAQRSTAQHSGQVDAAFCNHGPFCSTDECRCRVVQGHGRCRACGCKVCTITLRPRQRLQCRVADVAVVSRICPCSLQAQGCNTNRAVGLTPQHCDTAASGVAHVLDCPLGRYLPLSRQHPVAGQK